MDATLRGPANKRVIGNNIGHHLFQYLNKVQTDLNDNAAKIDRLEKDSAAKFERQERTLHALQAENRRLRSVKQLSQAVRSRLFENFRKASSLGSHDHKAIKSRDHVAHRGCLDEDWQLYEDRVRSDFEVFLKVYGIGHGEARMYIECPNHATLQFETQTLPERFHHLSNRLLQAYRESGTIPAIEAKIRKPEFKNILDELEQIVNQTMLAHAQ